MTSTSPNPYSAVSRRRPAKPNETKLTFPIFRAPPLAAAIAVDIATELDALRRRRIARSQRFGWVTG